MKFWKLHGAKNDFIFVEKSEIQVENPDYSEFARDLCTRRGSVGADGLVIVDSVEPDLITVEIYNADGSLAAMCGNALRVVGLWGVEVKGLSRKFFVRMGHREYPVWVQSPDVISVNLPSAIVGSSFHYGKLGLGTHVDVGNPHVVFFTDHLEPWPEDALKLSQELDANVHLARVEADGRIALRSWERGVGPTLSCGTGACAATAAAFHHGLIPVAHAVVELLGGSLEIMVEKSHSHVTGPARIVYMGETASIPIRLH